MMVPVALSACSVVPVSMVNVSAPQVTPGNFAQNVSHTLIVRVMCCKLLFFFLQRFVWMHVETVDVALDLIDALAFTVSLEVIARLVRYEHIAFVLLKLFFFFFRLQDRALLYGNKRLALC